jgi:hypothetical protein
MVFARMCATAYVTMVDRFQGRSFKGFSSGLTLKYEHHLPQTLQASFQNKHVHHLQRSIQAGHPSQSPCLTSKGFLAFIAKSSSRWWTRQPLTPSRSWPRSTPRGIIEAAGGLSWRPSQPTPPGAATPNPEEQNSPYSNVRSKGLGP